MPDKSRQDVLQIPGYQGNGAYFNAQKYARSVDDKIALHRSIVATMRERSFLWDSVAQRSADNGRLLVPASVVEDMEYTSMVHGYGLRVDDIQPRNALWDEVLESTHDPLVRAIDGNDAGYVLLISAYDMSRTSLIRILTGAQIKGRAYREYGWQVEHPDDKDE